MGIKAAIATEKRRLEGAAAVLQRNPKLRGVAAGLREAAATLEEDFETEAMRYVAGRIRERYATASKTATAPVVETADIIAGWLEESASRKKRTPKR